MPNLDLTSCWAKVLRAKTHREALRALDRATFLFPADCPTIGIKYDGETGEHVMYVSRMGDYSNAFMRASLLLGDAMHNLRSALDHLVYGLAGWHTKGSIRRPDSTQFPICDRPRDFEAAAKRYLDEVHPNHVAVIERFQTYRPSDILPEGVHPFALLRDLSNTDKHRLPNVVVIPTRAYVTNLDLFDLTDRLGQARLVEAAELGAEINRYVLRERLPDMQMIGHIPASISLPKIRQPLFLTLRTLEWQVAQVLRLFDPLTQ